MSLGGPDGPMGLIRAHLLEQMTWQCLEHPESVGSLINSYTWPSSAAWFHTPLPECSLATAKNTEQIPEGRQLLSLYG